MEKTVEINFKEMLAELSSKIWAVVLCAILAASIALVYTVYFVTPQYRSNVSFYVNNYIGNMDSDQINASDLATSQRLVATYLEVIKSDSFLVVVSQELDNQISHNQLKEMISLTSNEDTALFYVYVSHPDPNMAAKIANVVAEIAPIELPRKILGSSLSVIDYAKVPNNPYTPNYLNNTMYGALIGAMTILAVLVIRSALDIRVKSEADLKRICDAPVLGMIPDYDMNFDDRQYAPYIEGAEENEDGEA